jgi:AraC-like DNA-binding protein
LGSLSLYEIASFTCPASYVMPIEQSDSYAVYLVDKGKGVYTLGNNEFHIKKHDIFVMYPNMSVRCAADSNESLKMFALGFGGMDTRLLLNAARFEPKNPVRMLDRSTAKQISNIMDNIYTWRGQDIHSVVQSTQLIYLLLSTLVRTINHDQNESSLGWLGIAHFQKALNFIADNYSKPIKVTDISTHVYISRSRLYRVFMQHIFISPQQYLNEYRIKEAIHLLEKRKSSIKEVANAVGIKNSLYFSKLFKQVTGKSPRNYMKEINKRLLN